jgi:hypothetical protein
MHQVQEFVERIRIHFGKKMAWVRRFEYLVKTKEMGLHVGNVENHQSMYQQRRQMNHIKILMQRRHN